MLVVISVIHKLIIFCNSLKNDEYEPILWLKDTLLFLDYYYPAFKRQWVYDFLDDDERFQNPTKVDCGFHVLHFAVSAILDKRIDICTHVFEKFKIDVQTAIVKSREESIILTASLHSSRLTTSVNPSLSNL